MAAFNVYVDGFNLYRGSLQNRNDLKWLDLRRFAARLLGPEHSINRVRYFTAKIDGRGDTGAPQRQDVYLRALKTLSDLSITFGQFKRRQERMTKVARHGAGRERVLVWKTEEKGSDVNIATYLIWDALRGDGDASLVISGDTDLVLPIRMLTEELGRKVGVADGTLDRLPASQLTDAASFVLKIRIGPLADSQLQANLVDAAGVFHHPPKWDPPPPP